MPETTMRMPAGASRAAATFAIGIAGGALFHLAGVPLAWMLGALVAVASAGLAWYPTGVPPQSRQFGQIIAGTALGLAFTPAFVAQVVHSLGLMAAAALLSIGAGIGVSVVVARIAGIDRTTAYFASLPGGVAEMAVLADRFGGDTALVALSQSFRIVVVVLTVPVAISWLGRPGAFDAALHPGDGSLPVLCAMLTAGCALAYALGRLGVTNNWLLGGLLIGAGAAFCEVPRAGVPAPALVLSQLLIGCALGTRITRKSVSMARRFLPVAIGGTLTLLVWTLFLSIALSQVSPIGFEALVLGTAPGGAAETGLTARALHLNIGDVTAFHLVRILFIVLLSAPLYQLAVRRGRDRRR
ncbi:AbrB family transcriptional regulator [Methylobacterium indicum]|uniref:AbrB family transcriptional regulator n=1 Tax=Methylobacterium indicum TaxID=1775910 RepID=A0ABR5HH54_9HYPH|nr:AbrB family transcriptional regulator [Methylobacterium indicum]KMO18066.1 hypothetical protein QR78_16020 [Methylobacterium indicum]KMO26004.1 hypothetical protein QR79_04385 [Methylobacterium indicum]